MPEKCPSCGGYMIIKEIMGTLVISEMPDNKKRTRKYAFSSFERGEQEICPSCRRAVKKEKDLEASGIGSGGVPISISERSKEGTSKV
ncbi:MAG: hypothetical protein ACLFSW_05390 [Halobacteriales archaeon]